MSIEVVSMETVRTAIKARLAFEITLLEIFEKDKNHFGITGCEKAIEALNAVLFTLEKYKVSEKEIA